MSTAMPDVFLLYDSLLTQMLNLVCHYRMPIFFATVNQFLCRMCLVFWILVWMPIVCLPLIAEEPSGDDFDKIVEPLLIQYCYDCHGDGSSKGQVELDGFKSREERLNDKDFWFRILKNLKAGLMPPSGKPRPDVVEMADRKSVV